MEKYADERRDLKIIRRHEIAQEIHFSLFEINHQSL